MSARQFFRSRSTVVEAMQWRGDEAQAREWLGYAFKGVRPIDGVSLLLIENRTGRVNVYLGDWIIRDDDGFYPMHPSTFAALLEAW